MKRLVFFAILLGTEVAAQEVVQTQNGKFVQLNMDKTWQYIDPPKIVSADELHYNEKGFAFVTKSIMLKNGQNKVVPVEFVLSVTRAELDKVNLDNLENMIDQTSVASKYSLKNTSTYSPLRLRMSVPEKEQSVIMWMEFTGQNDYGAIKDSSKILYFDYEGNLTKEL